jgi:hypothetical protein
MKILPTKFKGKGEVRGIIFKQIFRIENICIYSRSDGNYETVRIRLQKQRSRVLNGNIYNYEEKEFYPKGKNWGPHEKCTQNFANIVRFFNQLADSLGYDYRLNIANFLHLGQ